MRRRIFFTVAGLSNYGLLVATSHAQAQARGVDIEALRTLIDLPDSQIDYAKAKLAIDRMVDPKIDVAWASHRLDEMASEIALMVAARGLARRISAADKIEALRAYLYLPGPWNKHQVFKYDLEHDPTGTKILGNKLIPNYLQHRLGNCVSMPILFLILAQKLRIDAALSTAPEHIFVKYRDEGGQYHNVEATHDGGLKRDSSYQREFEITQKAIDKGVYLRALPKKEGIAVMMGVLMDHLGEKRNANGIHAVADLILAHFPNSIDAALHKQYAYSIVLDERYKSKYSRFDDIPAEKRDEAKQLLRGARNWYAKAEALGWREPSKEFKAASEQLARNAKNNQ